MPAVILDFRIVFSFWFSCNVPCSNVVFSCMPALVWLLICLQRNSGAISNPPSSDWWHSQNWEDIADMQKVLGICIRVSAAMTTCNSADRHAVWHIILGTSSTYCRPIPVVHNSLACSGIDDSPYAHLRVVSSNTHSHTPHCIVTVSLNILQQQILALTKSMHP